MKKLKEAFGDKHIPLLSAKAPLQTTTLQARTVDPEHQTATSFSLRESKRSVSGKFYVSPKNCRDLLARSVIQDENAAKLLQKVVAKMPPK